MSLLVLCHLPVLPIARFLGAFFNLFNLSKSIFLLFFSSVMDGLFIHLNQCHPVADVIAVQQHTGCAWFHSQQRALNCDAGKLEHIMRVSWLSEISSVPAAFQQCQQGKAGSLISDVLLQLRPGSENTCTVILISFRLLNRRRELLSKIMNFSSSMLTLPSENSPSSCPENHI